jgi:predicted RNase H-like HicB family nuclease
MANRYTIELFYSEEDGGYIAVVPELSGCSAFGESEGDALREVKIAIDLWIETAKKENREILQPAEKEILKSLLEKVSGRA